MKSIHLLTAMITFSLSSAVSAITDGEMAKTLMTVNAGEITMAKMAKQKSQHPEVIKFAEHMISDHTKNDQNASRLLKQANIRPVESSKAMEMDKEGMATLKSLEVLNGAQFDLAYMEAQVQMHKKVLQTIETEFMPAVKNSQFGTLLSKTRDTVSSHIDHARQVQSKLQ